MDKLRRQAIALGALAGIIGGLVPRLPTRV